MIVSKLLHHTCGDRNPDDLNEAPFFSNNHNSYLGRGYYFWEDNLPFGKYWGYQFYILRGEQYMIVEFDASWNSDKFFDIIGDRSHSRYISEIGAELNKKGKKKWRVSEIIEYLKREGRFPFSIIRALDYSAIHHEQTILFTIDDTHETDLNPCLIICVTRIEDIDLSRRKLALRSSNPPK